MFKQGDKVTINHSPGSGVWTFLHALDLVYPDRDRLTILVSANNTEFISLRESVITKVANSPVVETVRKCSCSTHLLMIYGCTCGGK